MVSRQQPKKKKFVDVLRDSIWQFILGSLAIVLAIVALFFQLHPPGNPAPMAPTPQSTLFSTPLVTATNVPPMPTATLSQPSATDWGVLVGDSITLNRTLTCGEGCPNPLRVRIDTIQIDKVNGIMTWNVHFFAPGNSLNNGIADAAFQDFALQSDITPYNQATQSITPVGNLQAKFLFTPPSKHIYTLTVIATYHTLKDGIVSIAPTTLTFEQVHMSFNP